MKWILFVLVFCSLNAYSQEDTSRYQRYATTYGMQVPRMWASKVFRLPDTSRVNALGGALGTNPAKSELWLWNGENWSLIRGGGGSGTSYTGGLWTNITGSTIKSDSAAMASYFLRRKDSGVNYVTPFQFANRLIPNLQQVTDGDGNNVTTNDVFLNQLNIYDQTNSSYENIKVTDATVFISDAGGKETYFDGIGIGFKVAPSRYAGLSKYSGAEGDGFYSNPSTVYIPNNTGFAGLSVHGRFANTVGDIDISTLLDSLKSTISAGGTGTVSTLSVTTANGISGTVANASTTPAITLNLDATRWQTKAATKTTSDSVVALIPTNNNTLTNGAGYITSSSLTPYLQVSDSTKYSTKANATKQRDSVQANVTAEVTARATADALLVPKTTTVNGFALSGNITIPTASDTVQVVTSGTSVTVSNSTTWLIINLGSTASSFAITLAASPASLKTITVSFGNTVTALTVSANTGHTLVQSFAPTTVQSGESIRYKFYSSKWYSN